MSSQENETVLPTPEGPIGTSEKVRRLWEMRKIFVTTEQYFTTIGALDRRIVALEEGKITARKRRKVKGGTARGRTGHRSDRALRPSSRQR